MCLGLEPPLLRAVLFLLVFPLLVVLEAEENVNVKEEWAVCENRAYRDEEVEPGGLKLLGVKESPLGSFPSVPAPPSHEHFFQQLREVWSDDCPRIMVQLGLQPAPGRWRNWTTTALWLLHFNHSGMVLLVDAVEDYLRHAEAGLASLLGNSAGMRIFAKKALLAAESRPRAGERPVAFDQLGGGKVAAADEVMRSCSGLLNAEYEAHPCARVLKRMALPDPLEYTAAVRSFDDLWRAELQERHVDFLQVDLGSGSMPELLQRGFQKFLKARAVSILAFRVDGFWTKAALKEVVAWLDIFEYFSLFTFLCPNSTSRQGSFHYQGPQGAGPTTYLPISGLDLEGLDWSRLPLPQDVLALDLRQPDIFKTIQLGDAQCEADEAAAAASTSQLSAEGSCSPSVADSDSGECKAPDSKKSSGSGPSAGAAAEAEAEAPERPQQLRVTSSEAEALTLQWRAHPEGPRPLSYRLALEPGGRELELEHQVFDAVTGLQSYVLQGLLPGTRYSVRLQAVGPGRARGPPAVLSHTTEMAEASPTASAYDVLASLHCGMTPAEEVQPAGPPPSGTSFFRDTTDVDSCRARCDDDRRCVAFQVKLGDACWLYRLRPAAERLRGPRADSEFWCGVRRATG